MPTFPMLPRLITRSSASNRVICMPSNLLLDRGYDLTLRRSDTHFLANPDLRQLKQLFEPAHHQIQVR